MGGLFSRKTFPWGGQTIWANLLEVALHGEINDRIMQTEGEFHKCIFQ